MAKFIGVKMIEAFPMTAREANDKGHKLVIILLKKMVMK